MGGNFNITKFKSHIASQGGLSRGIFFECVLDVIIKDINTSGSGLASERIFGVEENELIICKAANLPTETIDSIELKYFTRPVRIPGSRQYPPITLTFYNTVNYSVLTRFKKWFNYSNHWNENRRMGYAGTSSKLTLHHYHNDGQLKPADLLNVAINTGISAGETIASRVNPALGSVANAIGSRFTRSIESRNPKIATYTFRNIFPTSISGLQFTQEDDSAYQTFDVEFQYLNIEYTPGEASSAKGTAGLLAKVGL